MRVLSERVFSVAGQVENPHGTRMCPNKLEMLIFMKVNIMNMKSLK